MSLTLLSNVSTAWKNINFNQFKNELDIKATEIAQRQDASDCSRRQLVDQTKEFKRSAPEELRKYVIPLLRSFQQEVDTLCKRSKASEADILSMYHQLIDLPDPVAAFDAALQIQKKAQHMADLEIECRQLRETLAAYNVELADVKNQEVTVKSLREQVKQLEHSLESKVAAGLRERERELGLRFAERERELAQRQLEAAERLGEAERRAGTLQMELDNSHTELFNLRGRLEEVETAKADETEMLVADCDRATERAMAAERDVAALQAQLSQAQELGRAAAAHAANNLAQEETLRRVDAEMKLQVKEREVAQLVDDVRQLQNALAQTHDASQREVARLEKDVSDRDKRLALMAQTLAEHEDYEEIKRELNVLRSIEFSQDSLGAAATAPCKGTEEKKSLEQLLLQKNHTLQNELTLLKIANQQLNAALLVAQARHTTNSTEDSSNLGGVDLLTAFFESVKLLAAEPDKFASSTGSVIKTTPVTTGGTLSKVLHLTQTLPTNSLPILSPSHCITKSVPHGCWNSIDENSNTQHVQIKPVHSAAVTCSSSSINGSTSCSVVNNAFSSCISNEPSLDTVFVAQSVRELLTSNNIGQRLFAKHVLGLSQGTVSELLSKPKNWDKLTEKGRDSYRKMNAWSLEPRNVILLKSLAPKKGQNYSTPPIVNKEDQATEQRVNQILQEAKMAMADKPHQFNEHMRLTDSETLEQLFFRELATVQVATSSNKTLKQTVHAAKDEENSSSSSSLCNLLHQMLEKAATVAYKNGNAESDNIYRQIIQATLQRHEQIDQRTRTTDDDNSSSCCGETSSLTDGAAAAGKIRPSTRNVMPPISQEQLNLYASLSTEDVVKQVKEILSQYSISQRLFGECVLGLSQGSVSDLLARPKPWHMLTQKGREPYIRMQMFVEQPDSIGKLLCGNYINLSKDHQSVGGEPSSIISTSCAPVEIDTSLLTNKVNEVLARGGISRAMFTKLVLGEDLSAEMTEQLLTCPLPWDKLTCEMRNLYVRMQIWLTDTHSTNNTSSKLHIETSTLLSLDDVTSKVVKKINSSPAEAAAAATTTVVTSEAKKKASPLKRASGASLDETMAAVLTAGATPDLSVTDSSLNDNDNSNGINSAKKPRVVFTEHQKRCLLQSYAEESYPRPEVLQDLSVNLALPMKTIVNWFHNHRMRCKVNKSATATFFSSSFSTCSSPSPSLQPIHEEFNEARSCYELSENGVSADDASVDGDDDEDADDSMDDAAFFAASSSSSSKFGANLEDDATPIDLSCQNASVVSSKPAMLSLPMRTCSISSSSSSYININVSNGDDTLHLHEAVSRRKKCKPTRRLLNPKMMELVSSSSSSTALTCSSSSLSYSSCTKTSFAN